MKPKNPDDPRLPGTRSTPIPEEPHRAPRTRFENIRAALLGTPVRRAMTAGAAIVIGAAALHEPEKKGRPAAGSCEGPFAGGESSERKKVGTFWVREIPESEKSFFEKHPRGEFTPDERQQHIKLFPHGEMILEDHGMLFYFVQSGDTIDAIRTKLTAYPEFEYLKDQRVKVQSFNIPATKLQAGMWLPIPHENKDRHITDEQFVDFANSGLGEISEHKKYGPLIKKILARPGMTPEKLVASMLAVAKKEAGGAPLGSCEVFRWEGYNGHSEFSFSIFHVIMSGPGLTARRELSMTEGQTYHPRNAVKLFIAFLFEKGKDIGKNPEQYFPFTQKSLEGLASFYNGKYWKANNRSYPTDIWAHYGSALETAEEVFDADIEDPKSIATPDQPDNTTSLENIAVSEALFIGIRPNEPLHSALTRADNVNGRVALTKDKRKKAVLKILRYLVTTYHSNKYTSNDRVAIIKNHDFSFVIFERDGKQVKLFLN